MAMNDEAAPATIAAPTPRFGVAPAPHIRQPGLSTRGVMMDVLIALAFPVLAATVVPALKGDFIFCLQAVRQIVICSIACLVAEGLFTRMRGRRVTLGDGSALVTGLILGLSLPASAPSYVGVIGGAVAIGIGKVCFGGLGQNIFNPAMVGRAFVMIAFAAVLAAPAYQVAACGTGLMTQATPLTGAAADFGWIDLLLGNHNGSIGEISTVACLLGGIYLCLRRVAAWEIPVALLVAMTILSFASYSLSLAAPWLVAVKPAWGYTVQHHLLSGSVVFGACFIATDPVTSPMTRKGRIIFGILVAGLVWMLRLVSSYPEGVMFAVLIGNACVPLINRFTVPTPVGGPLPTKRAEGGS
jgi:electron transport complex protein RnfD